MESKRIKLVKPSLTIVPQMFEAIIESQKELSVYLPWVPFSLTEDAVKTNAEKAIENFESFKEELRFSIICKHTERLLGVIGLMITDKSVPYFEIGYWLRTSEVGKGYITEAIGLLEQYAFAELDAKRVEIRAAESNIKSRAVAERCGYQFELTLQNACRLPSGQLSNTVIYAKLGDEI
ncbi:N-acetyltransferase [Photobacterium sanctipauli]|uniref:N-acetyltransferase n=1 Tax=Photobacterium sanctipauli TaxID=1342794 RepID=A0A2T3NZQ9_9GAMM|nr:GNAT family N-acetyltransferase [Photobacterium sanctipauli]PSW21699.1 N-acetyltransferase [Photobacterium sanctipauli]